MRVKLYAVMQDGSKKLVGKFANERLAYMAPLPTGTVSVIVQGY